MLKFFGKKRIKEDHIAKVFVSTINDLALQSFPIIAEFLNDVPELKESPKIQSNQVEWFLYIVFSANLYNLQYHFENDQLNRIRINAIDEFIASLEDRVEDVVLDNINNYEQYIGSLKRANDDSLTKAIAVALFHKYGLNNYQIDHFQKMNQPNPIIIKSICEITKDFLWNWNDITEKYKVVE